MMSPRLGSSGLPRRRPPTRRWGVTPGRYPRVPALYAPYLHFLPEAGGRSRTASARGPPPSTRTAAVLRRTAGGRFRHRDHAQLREHREQSLLRPVLDGRAVPQPADVGTDRLESLPGRREAEPVAGVRAGRAYQPGAQVALPDHGVDLAMDVGDGVAPLRDELLEHLPPGQVAHRSVVDVVLGEQLVGHLQPALVDDLVEHPAKHPFDV